MNMTWIDWSVIGLLVSVLAWATIYSKRLTKSVSDYLAANRCAGRYLLTLADGMAGFGVAVLVSRFEQFYEAGFGAFWWTMILAPLATIAALSGWVAYRYRETRALTMAELFERRYSRRFRVFAGSLCWISGLFNYGIFPMVTTNLLMNLFGFEESFLLLGFSISTRAVMMLSMLSVAVYLALAGGMITIMVTDFIQSQALFIALIATGAVMVLNFDWEVVSEGLLSAPPGRSRINPFDQELLDSFNLFFFSVFAFKVFYNYLGWQGGQGYFAAARTPHEFRMARILGEWRGAVITLVMLLVPICAFVFFSHPDFAAAAAEVSLSLEGVAEERLISQLVAPAMLIYLLPPGLLGLFTVALIFAAVSTDDTQLHSWGSIFVQDVLMPLRKKPFTPAMHMNVLRWAVIGVAVFAFFWSMYFPLRDYVLMYMLATGTIYLGGSGAVIIGGLYWRRATTAGAWCAMTVGAVIGLVGILAQAFWPSLTAFHGWREVFPYSGVQIGLTSYVASISIFVVVSLLTCKEPFNLEKLLHRGPYAVKDDVTESAKKQKAVPAWQRRMGVNTNFTRGDKIIYFSQISWTLFWMTAFITGTIIGVTIGISNHAWLGWWRFVLALSMSVGVVTIVWFMIGGIRDFRDLVRRLKAARADEQDDGWVGDEK
jgi:SSS family solute:Na+ symporter